MGEFLRVGESVGLKKNEKNILKNRKIEKIGSERSESHSFVAFGLWGAFRVSWDCWDHVERVVETPRILTRIRTRNWSSGEDCNLLQQS